VDGYRLQRRLGEGATGIVYEAIDERGAVVAVKLLRPELAEDTAFRARFAREARLARDLQSKHIAPILDHGVTYLVLPLYRGGTLAARLRECVRLDETETCDLAAQLARGLDTLHARGILHRDVKPSNVLFTVDGTAVLADFGLARSHDSTRLTLEGQVLGTPHYLAPELIEGLDATPASDVYALGCVLYECVVGEPPFTAGRLSELGFAHLVEPPPDPRKRRPELSADFADALLTALEKDPTARPPTATALARILEVARNAPRGRSTDGCSSGTPEARA